MQSELYRKLSLVIMAIAGVAFVYITVNAAIISNKRQIGTDGGIYTNCVSTSPYLQEKAKELIRGCQSELCEVQRILDYVTAIPYQVNNFRAHKPKETIANNYGDCDDKSNLLISLLHALGKEAYFVLVPEHIFVVTPLDGQALVDKKGLWIAQKKYYILESTAEGSEVGFPLKYPLDEIGAIVEPFSNEKLSLVELRYAR